MNSRIVGQLAIFSVLAITLVACAADGTGVETTEPKVETVASESQPLLVGGGGGFCESYGYSGCSNAQVRESQSDCGGSIHWCCVTPGGNRSWQCVHQVQMQSPNQD